jgi:hypothetical protein
MMLTWFEEFYTAHYVCCLLQIDSFEPIMLGTAKK